MVSSALQDLSQEALRPARGPPRSARRRTRGAAADQTPVSPRCLSSLGRRGSSSAATVRAALARVVQDRGLRADTDLLDNDGARTRQHLDDPVLRADVIRQDHEPRRETSHGLVLGMGDGQSRGAVLDLALATEPSDASASRVSAIRRISSFRSRKSSCLRAPFAAPSPSAAGAPLACCGTDIRADLPDRRSYRPRDRPRARRPTAPRHTLQVRALPAWRNPTKDDRIPKRTSPRTGFGPGETATIHGQQRPPGGSFFAPSSSWAPNPRSGRNEARDGRPTAPRRARNAAKPPR